MNCKLTEHVTISKEVVLTLTEEEAEILRRMMHLSVTIPKVISESGGTCDWYVEKRAACDFTLKLRRVLDNPTQETAPF